MPSNATASRSPRWTSRSLNAMPRSDLLQRNLSCADIEGETDDVEQVGALLLGGAVHHGLQLHRDERAGFGHRRDDLDALALRGDRLNREVRGGVVGPGVSGGMEPVAGITLGWSIST